MRTMTTKAALPAALVLAALNLLPAHAEDATSATAAEAFCEAAAVVSKSIGPDKDSFMAWCQPEAAKFQGRQSAAAEDNASFTEAKRTCEVRALGLKLSGAEKNSFIDQCAAEAANLPSAETGARESSLSAGVTPAFKTVPSMTRRGNSVTGKTGPKGSSCPTRHRMKQGEGETGPSAIWRFRGAGKEGICATLTHRRTLRHRMSAEATTIARTISGK